MTAPRVASPARRAVLAEVASRIPELGRPVLVTVDGVDGSGKTTFADELADVVEATGRFSTVVRASVDGFHHPREHRHAHGRTGETFWSRSFDYPALLRELVRPWRSGPGSSYRTAVHDVATETALDLPAAVVPAGGLLLLDGIFTQRDELREHWDLAVFLDVPFEASVSRMALRDGSVDDPTHPDQARYVEGQRIYFAACDPRSRADVVIDNTDLGQPRILSKIPRFSVRAPFPNDTIRATLCRRDVTQITEEPMPGQDSVAATRAALTSLAAAVLRIRNEYGDTLGVRRLTSDVDRLQADLDELGEPTPGLRPPVAPEERIPIPDEPYDESMWHDAQSEAQHAQ